MLCKKGAYRVSELGKIRRLERESAWKGKALEKIKRSERESPPKYKALKKTGSSERHSPASNFDFSLAIKGSAFLMPRRSELKGGQFKRTLASKQMLLCNEFNRRKLTFSVPMGAILVLVGTDCFSKLGFPQIIAEGGCPSLFLMDVLSDQCALASSSAWVSL